MGNMQGTRNKGKRRKTSTSAPVERRRRAETSPAAAAATMTATAPTQTTSETTPKKRRPPRKSHTHVGPASSKAGTKKEIGFVELLKQAGQTLGLVIAGGSDKGQPVKVGGLRPNGIAYRSESLQVGDRILAINGKNTETLTHDQVIELLKNAEEVVNLEIEYDAPLDGPSPDEGVITKTVLICLKKEGNTFGFTISGGAEKGRPLTVSYVRPGTVAYRSGTMKAGDRLLKLNGMNLKHATHAEVVLLLKNAKRKIALELEYDVTLHEGLEEAEGPVMVELQKPIGASLGLTLSGSQSPGDAIHISHIKDAGIADRCGALHVGDRLLSINGKPLIDCSMADTVQMLIHSDINMKLEIIPGAISIDSDQEGPTSGNYVDEWNGSYSDTGYGGKYMTTDPGSSPEMFHRRGSIRSSFHGFPSQSGHSRRPSVSSLSSRRSSSVLGLSNASPCHTETLTIELKPDAYGYGFNIQGVYDLGSGPFVVSDIENDSPAHLHGEFMIGDRILVLNGQRTNGMAVDYAWKIIRGDSFHGLSVETEIDIAESVIPGTGTFDVKLVKRGGSLGITINGDPDRSGPMWISQITKGGVAHRTGTLEPGDTLLAIDGRNLENAVLDDAISLLKTTGGIVTLQISKDAATAGPPGSILFSVELIRRGASLGITVHGSENPGDPVIISHLKEDGVAFRSGTLKVGDRILAINGMNLRMHTLVEAVQLLQTAGDVVKLKICRDPNSPPKQPLPTFKSEPDGGGESEPEYVHRFDSLRRRFSASNMSSASNTLPRRNAGPDRSTQRRLAMLALKDTGRSTPDVQSLLEETSSLLGVTNYRVKRRSRPELDETYIGPEVEGTIVGYSEPDYNGDNAGHHEPYGDRWFDREPRRSRSATFDAVAGTRMDGKQRTWDGRKRGYGRAPVAVGSWNKDVDEDEMERRFGEFIEPDPEPTTRRRRPMPRETSSDSSDTGMPSPGQRNRFRRGGARAVATGAKIDQSRVASALAAGSRPMAVSVKKIKLRRKSSTADFGFSVADGAKEKGVFVKAIRRAGPADGRLQAFDKLLQVNGVNVHDFDCCKIVPILAEAGPTINLIITRRQTGSRKITGDL
eukprot:m.60011 g.60011  ORF g.60011 m.60011 type:complete len:1093 (+) comp34911_c0_seq1:176-3454(+)